jgi:hypothetical protein
MALDPNPNPARAPGSPAPSASYTQRRRWLVFGSNVLVALLLATAVAVAALWMSGTLLKGKARSDWTSTGRFSLSPRTKAVLKDLKGDVQLTLLFTNPDLVGYPSEEDYRREAAQYERLKDLLGEYAMASGRVTTSDVDPLNGEGTDSLNERIHKKFAGDFARKEALLAEFDTYQKALDAFVAGELDQIQTFLEAKPPLPQEQGVQLFRAMNGLASFSEKIMAGSRGGAQADDKATLQKAQDLMMRVAEQFPNFPLFFASFSKTLEKPGPDGKPVPAPEGLKLFLKTAAARYEPLRKTSAALKGRFQDLAGLKFEKIEQALAAHARGVIVETDQDIQILTLPDLWITKAPSERASAADEGAPLFVGETALTGTLVGMTQPDRPAVFFVTFGAPATAYGGPFNEMADKLRKANFIVEDWDLAQSPEMPQPEHMTKAILVFMPPAPTRRGAPPALSENFQPALDAVKAGAPALVVGEPSGASGAPTVPYGQLFPLFGVTLEGSFVAVRQRGEQASVKIDLTAYSDHPITNPLSGLPTIFIAASPLEPSKALPEGVKFAPLLQTPAGTDDWAESDVPSAIYGNEAAFDAAAGDQRGPLTLGAAVTRDTPAGSQRVVLFGGHFAEDGMAFARGMERESRRVFLQFPGNAELFVNSALWAAGEDNLLATSPEALQARRLAGMGAWGLPLKILIIGGLPTAVLIVGLLVYLARRR